MKKITKVFKWVFMPLVSGIIGLIIGFIVTEYYEQILVLVASDKVQLFLPVFVSILSLWVSIRKSILDIQKKIEELELKLNKIE